MAEPIAGCAGRVVFNVQHTGQGQAIIGPTTTMGEEVSGLCSTTAAARLSKVITATDQTGATGTRVLARERAGDEAGTLSRLIWLVLWRRRDS